MEIDLKKDFVQGNAFSPQLFTFLIARPKNCWHCQRESGRPLERSRKLPCEYVPDSMVLRLFVLSLCLLDFAGCVGRVSETVTPDAGADAGSGASLPDSGSLLDAGPTDAAVAFDAGVDAGFPFIDAIACTPDGGPRAITTRPGVTPLFIGGGYGTLIAVSNNGLDWETVCELETPGGDDNFLIRSMAAGDGKLFAVGGSSTARIMLSYDGLHWADHSVPNKNWQF